MEHGNHNKSHSRTPILISFGIIAAILLAISVVTINVLNSSVRNLNAVTKKSEYQDTLIKNMHNAARDRIIALYQMSVAEDPFMRDELWMVFNQKGTEYINNRNKLYDTDIDEELRQLLEKQDSKLRPLGRIQEEISENLISGKNQLANKRLITEAAPLQREVLAYFLKLGEIMEAKDDLAFQNAYMESKQARTNIIIFIAISLLLTLSIAVFVLRTVRRSEEKILREKEHAQVTLHSIVDGVIMLDKEGYITELNDAAVKMLKQRKSQVIGKPYDDIIRLEMRDDEGNTKPVDMNVSVSGDGAVIVCETGVDLIRHDQSRLVVEYSLSPVMINDVTVSVVLVLHDITTMHTLARKLDYEASHDGLTGLYNRRKFEELLDQDINDAHRYRHTSTWLCYIDLDHFKAVNDTCGHLAGDQFLVRVADRITGATREYDHVARMGGDEFAVILRHAEEIDAIAAAERIRSSISDLEFSCNGRDFDVTGSLGLVRIDSEIRDMNAAFQHADSACYSSKHAGRNQLHVFRSREDQAVPMK